MVGTHGTRENKVLSLITIYCSPAFSLHRTKFLSHDQDIPAVKLPLQLRDHMSNHRRSSNCDRVQESYSHVVFVTIRGGKIDTVGNDATYPEWRWYLNGSSRFHVAAWALHLEAIRRPRCLGGYPGSE